MAVVKSKLIGGDMIDYVTKRIINDRRVLWIAIFVTLGVVVTATALILYYVILQRRDGKKRHEE